MISCLLSWAHRMQLPLALVSRACHALRCSWQAWVVVDWVCSQARQQRMVCCPRHGKSRTSAGKSAILCWGMTADQHPVQTSQMGSTYRHSPFRFQVSGSMSLKQGLLAGVKTPTRQHSWPFLPRSAQQPALTLSSCWQRRRAWPAELQRSMLLWCRLPLQHLLGATDPRQLLRKPGAGLQAIPLQLAGSFRHSMCRGCLVC